MRLATIKLMIVWWEEWTGARSVMLCLACDLDAVKLVIDKKMSRGRAEMPSQIPDLHFQRLQAPLQSDVD